MLACGAQDFAYHGVVRYAPLPPARLLQLWAAAVCWQMPALQAWCCEQARPPLIHPVEAATLPRAAGLAHPSCI